MYNIKLNNVAVQAPKEITNTFKQIKIESDTTCLNGNTVVGRAKYKRVFVLVWQDVTAAEVTNITEQLLKNHVVQLDAYDPISGDIINADCYIDGNIKASVKLWKNNKQYYGKLEATLEEVRAI